MSFKTRQVWVVVFVLVSQILVEFSSNKDCDQTSFHILTVVLAPAKSADATTGKCILLLLGCVRFEAFDIPPLVFLAVTMPATTDTNQWVVFILLQA